MISERFSVIFIFMMLCNPTEALDTQATRVTTKFRAREGVSSESGECASIVLALLFEDTSEQYFGNSATDQHNDQNAPLSYT